jgi:hypothetical protein
MMKKMASAVVVALVMAGGASAADKEMPKTPMKEMAMPMKDMVKTIKADKDGMISMKQVMDMEREHMSRKMKEMGMKGDKMTPADWEKLYDQIYRGT